MNKITDERSPDTLVYDIMESRSRFCNVFLITFSIIAIPALAASLYRITAIGWQPIMFVHIVIVTTLCGLTIFRKIIPYSVLAGFIVVIFIIIGLGGIYQFGLVAGGVAFLVVSSPIATLLFGGIAGIATLIVVLCGAAIIGFLTVSGNLVYGFDMESYAVTTSSWLTSIFSWGLASTGLTASLYVSNKYLVNALITSRQHQEAMLLSEERFRTIFEGAHDGIVIADNETRRFIDGNPIICAMLGYKLNELVSLSVTDIHRREDLPYVLSEFDKLARKETSIAHDIPTLRKDGSVFLADITTAPLTIDDRPVMAGFFRDITDKRNAEAEHARMQNELQRAQQMDSLGQLTGGIAHDFNNLLAVINGHAELMQSKYLNDKVKLTSCISNIKSASERAAELVSQMLSFSHTDNISDELIQLEPLLNQDVKMLRSTLPSSITIELEIDPGLPNVLMSSSQLHQILMNLAINARDAMQEKGKLAIRLGWVHDIDAISPVTHKAISGDWVELCVNDTGGGIDPNIQEKIFDPFFTTKGVGKGSGMGLSIIYRIMENHCGHILLESELGKGSTFRMLFAPALEGDDNPLS